MLSKTKPTLTLNGGIYYQKIYREVKVKHIMFWPLINSNHVGRSSG